MSEAAEDKAPITAADSLLEAKKRRAERFGVAVNITEADKKKIRAARFGLESTEDASGSAIADLDAAKADAEAVKAASHNVEEDEAKKAKRAARFGTPVKDPAEEARNVEKMKARAARFNTVTDAAAPKIKALESAEASAALKAAEEEKKKKRAERFGGQAEKPSA